MLVTLQQLLIDTNGNLFSLAETELSPSPAQIPEAMQKKTCITYVPCTPVFVDKAVFVTTLDLLIQASIDELAELNLLKLSADPSDVTVTKHGVQHTKHESVRVTDKVTTPQQHSNTKVTRTFDESGALTAEPDKTDVITDSLEVTTESGPKEENTTSDEYTEETYTKMTSQQRYERIDYCKRKQFDVLTGILRGAESAARR